MLYNIKLHFHFRLEAFKTEMNTFEFRKVDLSYFHGLGVNFHNRSSLIIYLIDIMNHVTYVLKLITNRTNWRHIFIEFYN